MQTSKALIGDPTRDKWLAFLTRAYEDGYLTLDEFQERADGCLAARNLQDVYVTLRDFSPADIEKWNTSWTEHRNSGTVPPATLTPPRQPWQDPPRPHRIPWQSTYLITALTTAVVVGLIEIIVMIVLG